MEREQLQREPSEAVAAYQRDNLMRLNGLVDEIEALGAAYRYNARRLRSAVQRKDQAEACDGWRVDPGAGQARSGRDVEVRRPRGARTPTGAGPKTLTREGGEAMGKPIVPRSTRPKKGSGGPTYTHVTPRKEREKLAEYLK